ncbi:DUF4405 domain-containing protein [Peribacillus sp. NPDC097895]|uniref:DUF4405 domain-containing protein n=1 Tax=Peribacillus sp. NPDC097895 TaxID=3390619 RepID=UPI003CFFE2FD
MVTMLISIGIELIQLIENSSSTNIDDVILNTLGVIGVYIYLLFNQFIGKGLSEKLKAYQITGNTIHELIGVILFLLFIAHNILNRRWYKTIFKGKHNVQRILSITVNLLFLVSMAVVMISSVPISRDIFAFISINNDMTLLQIHVMASYWGFIFMAVHIGMSWGTIINAVRKMTGITSTSRICTIAFRIIAVLIVVYGVQTSFLRERDAF